MLTTRTPQLAGIGWGVARKPHNTNEEWTIRLVYDLKEASAPDEYTISKGIHYNE